MANNVFATMSKPGNTPAQTILRNMRHIPPLVIYIDAPVSYMAEGMAYKFFQGEGEATNGMCDDPSVVNYFIVQTSQKENLVEFETIFSGDSGNEADGNITQRSHVSMSALAFGNSMDSHDIQNKHSSNPMVKKRTVTRLEQKYGCRLVGMIPCSDAFGVDLVVDKYEKELKRRESVLQQKRQSLLPKK